jgi:protease II
MSVEYNKNIFINCPFDDTYREILLGVLFTTLYLKYTPRLALESFDSGQTRVNKIVNLIEESKFGIHDLSRMVSSGEGEYFRMNMPFELGIDYACQNIISEKFPGKKILILDAEQYRYQKSISDLSGCDIKKHHNDVIKAVKSVRDWLVTVDLKRAASGNKIWAQYNDFQAYLYEEVVVTDGHLSIDDVQITEIIHHMKNWCTQNPSFF